MSWSLELSLLLCMVIFFSVVPPIPQNDFILRAAMLGHTDEVQNFTSSWKGAMGEIDWHGAFKGAASNGHVPVIKVLLESKNLDYWYYEEVAAFAMQEAAYVGDFKMTELLLNYLLQNDDEVCSVVNMQILS